ncbi:glycosyl transferase family 2 [Microbispora cellulosiformans]|uniref:Glycosyl transferase family 2 n=1 Tax=Microbispora cellulosiformans TaxID=2614688 RepID=A0A5J5KA89_9ACTN|nr:glycosyl transferase family 2 [Microbispora cellulosiformans]KAA9381766.1 glycosyl transferase family 2 [Microbispora cellulosiformans]
MRRTATRSAWGTWIGFESCPSLLGRLVEGFSGPWTPLEDLPVPAPAQETAPVRETGLVPETAHSRETGPVEKPALSWEAAVAETASVLETGCVLETASVLETGCVVLAARSPADLRRAVPLRALLPRAPRVRIAVADVPPWAGRPLPATGQASCWRLLTGLRVARRGRGWHLDAAFSEPVAAGEILAHVAYGLFGTAGTTTPVAGLAGMGAAEWRPGDANATLAPADGPVPDRRDAPGCDLRVRAGASRVPPVDEAVVNPIGFRPHPEEGVAELVPHRDGFALTCGSTTLVRLPPSGRVTDVDVARLRDIRGVAVPTSAGLASAGSAAAGFASAAPMFAGSAPVVARVVAALAAAGVPVLAEPDPARDEALGSALAAVLATVTTEALACDLRREEISIRLRRTALREHGSAACWRRLAAEAGLSAPPPPRVSILLCTRRPEMLPFALEQMERQRGVTAELIVGLHGFTAREAPLPRTSLPVTVIEAPGTTPFGEVLNRMAAAASGSYLAKVDDDDWYGPDHLADLLLARLYSGADLVGSAAEFVYLEQLDVTIRRCIGTERFAPLVAGGTMLVTRAAFEAAGGFRPLPRTVDGQLLQAVETAGGRIYRTHGFGYLLRRRSAYGHTWRQPVQSFLASYQEQWRGLVFNGLMKDGAPWRAEVRT